MFETKTMAAKYRLALRPYTGLGLTRTTKALETTHNAAITASQRGSLNFYKPKTFELLPELYLE